MSRRQLATRMTAIRAGVPANRATRGELTDEEFRRFGEAAAMQSSLPIWIDDRGGISIAQLSARARRMKRKHNIGLLIIDYLQLMTGSSRRDGHRVQEITDITTGLKALAKELNIPVIALSQLNRDAEKRQPPRPQLSDLRESGSIEQDADIVVLVFREE